MGRWVSWCLAAAALSLLVARFLLVPERDSWNVVVGAADGSVAVLRFTVSNTGLLANEETTRVAVVRDDNFPLEHRAVGGPGTIDTDGVHGTADTLKREGGEWSWALTGDAMRSAGRVIGQWEACTDHAGTASGFLDVPNFSAQAAEGGIVRGPCMVFRTLESGRNEGAALYAMSSSGALFMDPAGNCPAWIDIGGSRWSGSVSLSPPDFGTFDVSFGPHLVTVRPGERFVRQGPETTTLLGERWLALAAGFPLPSIVLRSVRVSVDGASSSWSGLLVVRSFE